MSKIAFTVMKDAGKISVFFFKTSKILTENKISPYHVSVLLSFISIIWCPIKDPRDVVEADIEMVAVVELVIFILMKLVAIISSNL